MSGAWGDNTHQFSDDGPEPRSDLFGPLRGDPHVAPDLTDSILGAVEQKRSFLSRSQRRLVTGGRLAVGLAFVALVGVAAIIYQTQPSWAGWADKPTPVAGVVSGGKADVSTNATHLRAATECLLPAAQECGLLVLPYIPAPEELAIAAAKEGPSTLGCPGAGHTCEMARPAQQGMIMYAALNVGGLTPVSSQGSMSDVPLETLIPETHDKDDGYVP